MTFLPFALAAPLLSGSFVQESQPTDVTSAVDPVPDRATALAAWDADEYDVAWRGLAALAGGDDPLVDFCVGFMLATGSGTQRDLSAAARAYERAARAGISGAQRNLGWMYDKAEGVPFDPRKAVDLLLHAAYGGQLQGATDIGYAFATGCGRAVDSVEAWAWSKLAADLGAQAAVQNVELLEAELHPLELVRAKRRREALEAELLGELEPARPLPPIPSVDEEPLPDDVTNEDGLAAHRQGDLRLALRIFEKLGDRGDATAAFNAGYLLGEHDPVAAVEWYDRAARMGDADAAYRLGLAFATGTGCDVDLAEAEEWLGRAAEVGVEGAAEALEEVREQLRAWEAPVPDGSNRA